MARRGGLCHRKDFGASCPSPLVSHQEGISLHGKRKFAGEIKINQLPVVDDSQALLDIKRICSLDPETLRCLRH